MTGKKPRKSYPLEFKKKAVMMTTKEGISLSDAADELGIPPQYLSQWRSKLLQEGELEDADKRLDALEEVRRLREELKQAKMENEILKKAAKASIRQRNTSEKTSAGSLNPSVFLGL